MIARWKAALAAVLAAIFCWRAALMLSSWYLPAQKADLPLAGQTAAVNLPILMYHHIHKSPEQWGEHVVLPETLEGDFRYLKEQGFTAVTIANLIAYEQEGRALPEKSIMITFDDGQLSVMEYALPLLEKYDLKAVVAVVGAFAEEYTQSGDRNVNYACMNWADIGALARSGRVEIASHTYGMHSLESREGCRINRGECAESYQAAFRGDLEKNEELIQGAIGRRPTAFAYPYGALYQEAKEILYQQGYQVLFTCTQEVNHLTGGHPEELYELGRFNRSNDLDREALFRQFS